MGLGLGLPDFKFDLEKVRLASNWTLDSNETEFNAGNETFGESNLLSFLEGLKGHISGEWEISKAAFYFLMILYIVVIIVGACGNSLGNVEKFHSN